MKTKALIITILICGLVFGISMWQIIRFINIDDCLDRGCYYDYSLSKCIAPEDVDYKPPLERVPIRIIIFSILISAIPTILVFAITKRIAKNL